MVTHTEYTVERAERIAAELRAMPAKEPSQRRLDKQGVVRHLASEILALQERGYTLEEIAESLRGHGLDITTLTLKNYLQRTKGPGDKPKRPRRRSGAPRVGAGAKAVQPTHASALPPVAVTAPPESASTLGPIPLRPDTVAGAGGDPAPRSGKAAFLIKDKESY